MKNLVFKFITKKLKYKKIVICNNFSKFKFQIYQS